MRFSGTRRALALVMLGGWLVAAGCAQPAGRVVDLEFLQAPDAGSDTARTLASLVKVQGTGQFREDGLYLITQFGDRRELFERENQRAMDHPMLEQTWRHCSVFSVRDEESTIVGRNWDNQNVGSIIVSLSRPPGGYASISFSRSIDIGFGHKDLQEVATGPFEDKLLLVPFYAMDGINEHGLVVAVAGNSQTDVVADPQRPPIFIPYLIRTLLDETRTVEEAVDLAGRYAPFDVDRRMLVSHLLVADPSGRSVVLEYEGDHWETTYGRDLRQVMTTRPVHGVSDAQLREKCWRYRGISEALEKPGAYLGWPEAMEILRGVAQKGTTWSVVYSLASKELYFSVYQDWGTTYHLVMP